MVKKTRANHKQDFHLFRCPNSWGDFFETGGVDGRPGAHGAARSCSVHKATRSIVIALYPGKLHSANSNVFKNSCQ